MRSSTTSGGSGRAPLPSRITSIEFKETLSAPEVVRAAIGYYRATYRAMLAGALDLTRIAVPSLVGSDDPHRVLADGQEEWSASEYRLELIDGARHFVHRERPDAFNRLLFDWLQPGTQPLPHD